jgi:short-subunit dehydrogenase
LIDRDESGLEILRGELDPTAVIVGDVRADLRDQLDEIALRSQMPYLEAFLCAGTGSRGPFLGLDERRSGIEAVEVNLLARLRLAHHMLRYMRSVRFGRLVLISSSSALAPMPAFAAYAASNAALLTFGEALAREVRPDGVHVLTVCPSGMDTQFQEQAGVRRVPGERLLDPDKVAEDIWDALGEPRRTVLFVGGTTHAMNLFQRLTPRAMQTLVWERLVAARR